MARPEAPESRTTSTSTVGLPRESRTSRPITCSIKLTVRRHSCSRCGKRYHPRTCPDQGILPAPRVGRRTGARRSDTGAQPRASTSAPEGAPNGTGARSRGRPRGPGPPPTGGEEEVADLGGPGPVATLTVGYARRRPPVAAASAATPSATRVASSASAGQHHADGRGLALELGRQRQGGQGRRDPLGHAGPALLRLLDGLPVGGHVVRRVRRSTSPNTWGCRDTSLSCTPRATSARVNRPSSAASVAWKYTWNNRSPSSSSRWATAVASMVAGGPTSGRRPSAPASTADSGVDGLQDLVGLLEQVPAERGVGLAPVPRAPLAQGADQLVEGAPARRRPERPAAGSTARSGGRARRTGRAPPRRTSKTGSSGRPRWWRTRDRLSRASIRPTA